MYTYTLFLIYAFCTIGKVSALSSKEVKHIADLYNAHFGYMEFECLAFANIWHQIVDWDKKVREFDEVPEIRQYPNYKIGAEMHRHENIFVTLDDTTRIRVPAYITFTVYDPERKMGIFDFYTILNNLLDEQPITFTSIVPKDNSLREFTLQSLFDAEEIYSAYSKPDHYNAFSSWLTNKNMSSNELKNLCQMLEKITKFSKNKIRPIGWGDKLAQNTILKLNENKNIKLPGLMMCFWYHDGDYVMLTYYVMIKRPSYDKWIEVYSKDLYEDGMLVAGLESYLVTRSD